ncbi:protein HID1-like isoform X2 [Dreissena polymorpha]|uniref:protein HID1-like isoform X2 n=1 Tax=Dreissena polymorpha TaxID=45954 RepID=UPI002263BDB7|nr:protein HID1-like isoform X2 [Dreissena polymorpha]
MGNTDTKLNFRKAVIQLTTKTQPIEASDEAFWEQFWSDCVTCVQDVFTLIPAAEIRALREESPSNLATLCYKAVEKLVAAAESGCPSQREQQIVLNCVRLLTRVLPYIFEDPDWRGFFWSTLPGQAEETENESPPLAQTLLNALCDLLFCPEFTVASNRKSGPDNPEDMASIDSCEYIWEAGVGFANSPHHNVHHDNNRSEIIKLLLTCFSETMYLPPIADAHSSPNQWIHFFTSTENRHALPLFTSLINVVCAYDPVGYGLPYNHLMFTDSREALVESALQVLCVTMENEATNQNVSVDGTAGGTAMEPHAEAAGPDNLFVNYLSRIHREEDFHFILKGITRLLNNPLMQTYLPGSTKKIHFHQELLVLFWKMCDINKKFMFYVLKSSDVLDILVPILYYLNDARADQSRVGLMHIGVFILLLLSGERNFGVRLNKPYTVRVPMDIPVFTGTHADFLIIVFHKVITTGHQRLQPLFDCLLTIIVNVSPYLKTLSMVASTKLLHLLEAFSTPWFLYASPTNHHLVFFLLEVFNNIIQYQFDGNCNLVYTIIRKRQVFHQLANLPTDHTSIAKALTKKGRKLTQPSTPDEKGPQTMEGALPAAEAEPGTLKVSLAATPRLDKMTEPTAPDEGHKEASMQELVTNTGTMSIQPRNEIEDPMAPQGAVGRQEHRVLKSPSTETPPTSPTTPTTPSEASKPPLRRAGSTSSAAGGWVASPEWVHSWKHKLPLQTIMRMLQVLVPQVEKICIDKGLTDESEILKFLQHGTLVGLLPVPHPILIRKYQANSGTTMWFRTYLWGVIYLRNVDPPIWYDTNVKLFEIQRV